MTELEREEIENAFMDVIDTVASRFDYLENKIEELQIEIENLKNAFIANR